MRLGFTGTREGMAPAQRTAFALWLYEHCFYGTKVTEFHHGACVGADAFAALVVREEAPSPNPVIHAHPTGMGAALVSQEALANSTVVHPARPPLDRNRDIVDATDVLLACPKGLEERRSGTWSTVRYARWCDKRVVIFWPDGRVEDSHEPEAG